MQTKFLFYIIIGILVVAGVAGASWYFVTRQPVPPPEEAPPPVVQPPPLEVPADETANWKTYRNDEDGFEFKYPSQFEILRLDQITPTRDLLPELLIGIHQRRSFPEYNLSVENIFIISKSADINKCQIDIQLDKPLINPEIVKIDDVNFTFQKFTGAALGTSYFADVYRAITNIGCFGISLGIESSSDWNIPEAGPKAKEEELKGSVILNQILSTFRFSP